MGHLRLYYIYIIYYYLICPKNGKNKKVPKIGHLRINILYIKYIIYINIYYILYIILYTYILIFIIILLSFILYVLILGKIFPAGGTFYLFYCWKFPLVGKTY